jgi:hypothetical protein
MRTLSRSFLQGILNGAFVPTLVTQGTDTTIDSNCAKVASTGQDVYNSGPFGTVDLTQDCGLVRLLEIGDFVFNDVNQNGLQDAGDTPVANMPVQLYDSTGTTLLAATATNAAGLYKFTHVGAAIVPQTAYLVVLPASAVTTLTPTLAFVGSTLRRCVVM